MALYVRANPLCEAADSQLVVVDIQKRLSAAMDESDRSRVIRSASVLVQAAGLMEIPLLVTEQYPHGLGPTEEEVAWHFPKEIAVLEKTRFASTGSEIFVDQLRANRRRQVILVGMETHVCVLQTAMQLRVDGYDVFVVEDGVCSRSPHNNHNALARMRDAGVIITNVESVLFEWLRDSLHQNFKTISSLIK